MTARERVIQSAAARACATIRREADANSEQPHEATPERVQRAAVDAVCTDPRVEQFNASRIIPAIVRNIEDSFQVRRGWWS